MRAQGYGRKGTQALLLAAQTDEQRQNADRSRLGRVGAGRGVFHHLDRWDAESAIDPWIHRIGGGQPMLEFHCPLRAHWRSHLPSFSRIFNCHVVFRKVRASIGLQSCGMRPHLETRLQIAAVAISSPYGLCRTAAMLSATAGPGIRMRRQRCHETDKLHVVSA